MPITDEMLSTLRAQLAGRAEEHESLLKTLDKVEVQKNYPTLVAAAFFLATNRRFFKGGAPVDRSQVIEFVAGVRQRTSEASERIDPDVAERLILAVFGEGSISDIDDDTVYSNELFLLAGLISDANLSDADLDAFMAKVRTMAEEG